MSLRHRPDLHSVGLETIIKAFPGVPHISNSEKGAILSPQINTVGVSSVASIVPKCSKVGLCTVITIRVLVFVEGGELLSIVMCP